MSSSFVGAMRQSVRNDTFSVHFKREVMDDFCPKVQVGLACNPDLAGAISMISLRLGGIRF